jgi:hypothetical protein
MKRNLCLLLDQGAVNFRMRSEPCLGGSFFDLVIFFLVLFLL